MRFLTPAGSLVRERPPVGFLAMKDSRRYRHRKRSTELTKTGQPVCFRSLSRGARIGGRKSMPENVRSDQETHQNSNRKVRLFSGPLSMFGAKVQIAAHEKNIDFELVMVPFTMK